MYENLAILAIFVFVFSIVAGGLERTPISSAIVFTAFGLVFGPLGLSILSPNVDGQVLRFLAEMTLALLLFIDAAMADLAELRRSFRIPQRMVLISLPLTILLGFGVGVVMFDELGLLEVAVLATMLAATDAALGKTVITNQAVPKRVREGLNFESGLNDGVCVPILLLFLALATAKYAEHDTTLLALQLIAQEIGIGALVGVALTIAGAWLIQRCEQRGWITEIWMQVSMVALAVACFAAAHSLHGSGFIASFVGGLVFGYFTSKKERHKLLHAAEGTAETLSLITWVIFGAAVIGQSIGYFSWKVVIYAVLSLTVIRMLPVYLSLWGMQLRTDEKLFLGWFGPRGLATIVFAVMVLNEDLPGEGIIVITAVCTILLSVIAHGLSANPLIRVLAERVKKSQDADPPSN